MEAVIKSDIRFDRFDISIKRTTWIGIRLWHIWSATMGPKLIGPSGQTVPNQFGPHGQMVPKNLVPMDKLSPTNLVPLDKWSLEYSVCPGRQAIGIRKYRDRIGWGPFVHGDWICWGPFVQGDQFYGDHLSRGTENRGPEVHGSNGFGTKCIAVQTNGEDSLDQGFWIVKNRKILSNMSTNWWDTL